MQQAGAVHGGERLADLDADQRRLARAEAALLLENLLERARPRSSSIHSPAIAVGARRAVDGDDAAMAHPGEQPAFVDDDRGVVGLLPIRRSA